MAGIGDENSEKNGNSLPDVIELSVDPGLER
jgi:hypothetical protein